MSLHYTRIDSPVGVLLLVADEHGLREIAFDGDRVDLPAGATEDDGPFTEVVDQLSTYFAGQREDFDLPLAPQGTAFQLRVWDELSRIPYGTTISYGELAARVGSPGAARAVGLANGSNPLPIVVPCHRVIGANGKLTGYGGGMERKRILLDLERRVVRPDAAEAVQLSL